MELQVSLELSQIPGTYPDEVSLLTKISQMTFQCVPIFAYIEIENHTNAKMRFQATLLINKLEVGKGFGANKKQAKTAAAKMALQAMVPSVYREWVFSDGRKVALNKINLNGEEVLMKEQKQLSPSQLSSPPPILGKRMHDSGSKENVLSEATQNAVILE